MKEGFYPACSAPSVVKYDHNLLVVLKPSTSQYSLYKYLCSCMLERRSGVDGSGLKRQSIRSILTSLEKGGCFFKRSTLLLVLSVPYYMWQ